jgi:hypothetical protein
VRQGRQGLAGAAALWGRALRRPQGGAATQARGAPPTGPRAPLSGPLTNRGRPVRPTPASPLPPPRYRGTNVQLPISDEAQAAIEEMWVNLRQNNNNA